jgi:Acetyl-CoA carboxylase alpha subunit
VVTGEGGSGGALALGVADRVLACAHAVYSVISPEGCAAIVWKDPAAAPAAAAALRLDSAALLEIGVIDAVIPEPAGGAHNDPVLATSLVRAAVVDALGELLELPVTELVRARAGRFRAFGRPTVEPAGSAELGGSVGSTDLAGSVGSAGSAGTDELADTADPVPDRRTPERATAETVSR